MPKHNHSDASVAPATDADELALRIGEVDLWLLILGITWVLAMAASGGSGQAMVPVSPSRPGGSSADAYVDKPIAVTVTPAGLEIGQRLVPVDHLGELKEVAGRPVLVQPEPAPEVERLLRALSGLRDAGAAVHVMKKER